MWGYIFCFGFCFIFSVSVSFVRSWRWWCIFAGHACHRHHDDYFRFASSTTLALYFVLMSCYHFLMNIRWTNTNRRIITAAMAMPTPTWWVNTSLKSCARKITDYKTFKNLCFYIIYICNYFKGMALSFFLFVFIFLVSISSF